MHFNIYCSTKIRGDGDGEKRTFSDLFSHLAENDPMSSVSEKAQKRASLLLEVTAVTTANSVVTTFSNGSFFPSMGSNDPLDSVGRFFIKKQSFTYQNYLDYVLGTTKQYSAEVIFFDKMCNVGKLCKVSSRCIYTFFLRIPVDFFF